MNELLKIILSLSLSGSILILILLLLRPLLRSQMSWRWQYYIWLLVIARLLLPLTPAASVTGNLFRQAENRIVQTADSDSAADGGHPIQSDHTAGSGRSAQSNDTADSGRPTQADHAAGAGNTAHSADTVGSSQAAANGTEPADSPGTLSAIPVGHITGDLLPALCALWLVTALLLFVRKVTIYQSFVKYVNAGSAPVDDIAILERFGQIIKEQHVHGTIDLRVNSLVSSPLLIGFRHARIILPTIDLPADDFYYTVLHELTHYRRRDMFYKWLVQLTVCLHWFNPFVHVMAREINRLCELSCDERVISTFPDNLRKSYGDTLLNAIGTGGTYRDAAASVTLHESKELIKERLDAIMNFRKIPKWIKNTAVLLTGILVGGAVVLGAYATPDSSTGSARKLPSSSAASDHETFSEDSAGILTENDTDDSNSLPDYTIQYEDNIYYIMVDGADENDKPLSIVTQGYKKLVLVRKDEYATMGAFANRDMSSLVRYVKEQCRTLLENGRITQESADLFMKAAEEIQDNYTAQKSSSGVQPAYSYTQTQHYRKPYIIDIGYNLPVSDRNAYAGTLLTLSDESTLPVYFSAETAKYMADENVLSAITALLEHIISRQENTAQPVEAPFISAVEYVGDTAPETLAEKYYHEDTLPYFVAVYPALDEEAQRQYLGRMFADDEIGFFSCCIGLLEDTDAYTELVEYYILKAYEQQNTGFFATLAGMLDEASRKRWQEKCQKDGNSNYYYLLREVNETITEEPWEKENRFGEINTSENLSDEDFSDETAVHEELIADRTDKNNNDEKTITNYQEEYNEQNIVIIKNAYYYQNARVRILMDVKADGSFENFAYNKRGTVDLRLVRDSSNKIIRVEYLTAEESAEILEDIDDYPVTDPDNTDDDATNIVDLNRLTRDEVSDVLRQTLDSCNPGKWYLIDDNGTQYIYYNGLPHTYAYEPWITGGDTGDLITVEITDINIESPLLRSDEALSHYVLLSFAYTSGRADSPFSLTLKYNNVPVTYEIISTTTD